MPRGRRSAQPGDGLLPEGEMRSQCELGRVLQEFRPGPGPLCDAARSLAFVSADHDRSGLRSGSGLSLNDSGIRRPGATSTTPHRVNSTQPAPSDLELLDSSTRA
jgi:hypothetical protein